jgi:SAM-dependent methyltransferase
LSYIRLGKEYYDPGRPTVRNFDEATQRGIRQLDVPLPTSGLGLETGAGRGRLHEYFPALTLDIVRSDISMEMLQLPSEGPTDLLVRCDNLDWCYGIGKFSFIGALLFDSYNTKNFFENVLASLMPGGLFIGTLPHIVWGNAFRLDKNNAGIASFPMRDGTIIEVPSMLSSEQELRERLETAGFCEIVTHSFMLRNTESRISPHVSRAAEHLGLKISELPLIQYVQARKPLHLQRILPFSPNNYEAV